MSGIPIQGSLFSNAYGAPLARLDNIPQMVWDASIPFSVIYTNSGLATITNSVTIVLKGSGHEIDAGTYNNLNYVTFNSGNSPKVVTALDGAYFSQMPHLEGFTTLLALTTDYLSQNPSNAAIWYVGIGCSFNCDGTTGVTKGILLDSLTETQFTVQLYYGSIGRVGKDYDAQTFTVNNQAQLLIVPISINFGDTSSVIDPTCIYGNGSLLIGSSIGTNFLPASEYTNFTGTVINSPSNDTTQIKGAPLQLANLTAIQQYEIVNGLRVGQLAYDISADKMYKYMVISSDPLITPHTVVEFGSGGGGNLSTIYTLNITSDGQTSFTLTNTPTGIFGIILNGSCYTGNGSDFSVLGTALTWLNPNGVNMNIGDSAVFIYNFAISPTLKYLIIPITGTLSTSNAFYPFDSFTTNTSPTIAVMFTFDVPENFTSLVSFKIPGFIHSSSANGGPYNYNFTINHAADGELSTSHTTTVVKAKDFTGKAATMLESPMFDLTTELSSILTPNTKIGIAITSDLTHHVALSNATLSYI
jgi:hypothetical protein